jgi:N-ethylmaleimide reductase
LRAPFKDGPEAGGWIVNNGYARSMAQDAVAAGRAAAVAFGKAFSANPDLVERQRRDAPLAEAKRATFYGGGAEGYTDDTALAD